MNTTDLNVVLKIAEHQSITAAANHLDMSSSAASIALKRIEKELGAELFVRTTRQLRLSAAGEQYLPICQQALDLLKQGQKALNDDPQAINGEVRMAMSSEMGRHLMRRLLNEVMAAHQELAIRFHVGDSQVDFYRDGVDVALRAMAQGAAEESNFYGFKICNIPHVLCASPQYIAEHGVPTNPTELGEHNALLYKLYKVINDQWVVTRAGKTYKVKMRSNRAGNDGDLVRRWCIDGAGIAKKSAIDVAEDLLAGRVQRFMTDYTIPRTELWLVLPSRQMISPAIRLIRDRLKEQVSFIRLKLINSGVLAEHEWPE
ncbi:LysR family transcriptional regulator [Ferrimonas lipolytica]|uniref:LysR family transcriptional regulator n=1 Tax=Ferrimonas lipolytica TaxID=2724191 RepID=A0A6H1UDW2_9GAMM|nr:LysR family transcriptional regulator [Ferrimonas lipolytica]QIZ77275.1 LysR family transcriptional regulator [Ferrimonas lipolytica]